MADQTIDLLWRVVEMWRAAQAAFAEDDFGFVVASQGADDLGVVVVGGGEADDAAPLGVFARADDVVAFGLEAGDQVIGEVLDLAGNGGDADLQE